MPIDGGWTPNTDMANNRRLSVLDENNAKNQTDQPTYTDTNVVRKETKKNCFYTVKHSCTAYSE